MKNRNTEKINFKIDKNGSLGLLAIGDVGLRAWREVKKSDSDKTNTSEEKE